MTDQLDPNGETAAEAAKVFDQVDGLNADSNAAPNNSGDDYNPNPHPITKLRQSLNKNVQSTPQFDSMKVQ